jgi:transcriptional regulator with XRE-family HTH domain
MVSHANTAKLSPTEQAVVYGGIAATIRKAMARKKITPADVNLALGRDRGAPSIYYWMKGLGAPNAEIRPKLARVLGVPEDALRKAELTGGPQAAAASATALARLQAPATGRLPDVLTFAVLQDGTARLRLDVTTSAERGVALLRLLLDAGQMLSVSDPPAA